ncbi:hypothetical protein C8Q80DRAFT_912273 [Daedaleopsis nitida]|nr:hypothetical protein C8Q80DRAFT_912273 [Daedaleopsis nitida]
MAAHVHGRTWWMMFDCSHSQLIRLSSIRSSIDTSDRFDWQKVPVSSVDCSMLRTASCGINVRGERGIVHFQRQDDKHGVLRRVTTGGSSCVERRPVFNVYLFVPSVNQPWFRINRFFLGSYVTRQHHAISYRSHVNSTRMLVECNLELDTVKLQHSIHRPGCKARADSPGAPRVDFLLGRKDPPLSRTLDTVDKILPRMLDISFQDFESGCSPPTRHCGRRSCGRHDPAHAGDADPGSDGPWQGQCTGHNDETAAGR